MCYLSLRTTTGPTDNRRVRSVKSSAIFSASNKSNRNFPWPLYLYVPGRLYKGREHTHTHTHTSFEERRGEKKERQKKEKSKREKDELLFALHQKSGGFASCVNKLQTTSICVPVFPFLLRSLCYFFLSFFSPVVSFLISSPDTLPAVATPQGISRHRFLTPVFYRYFYLLLLKFFGGVLSIHSIKDVRQTKQTGARI